MCRGTTSTVVGFLNGEKDADWTEIALVTLHPREEIGVVLKKNRERYRTMHLKRFRDLLARLKAQRPLYKKPAKPTETIRYSAGGCRTGEEMQPSGPTQPPYQQPPYQQPPQPYVVQAPPVPDHVARYVVIAVIAVIVVGLVLGIGIPLAQQSVAAPKITLTDATYSVSGCGFFGPNYWVYSWSFTLVNSGTANGFAIVMAYVDGGGVGEVQYFVPSGSQVSKGFSVSAPDCNSHSPNIGITSVTKA